MPWIILLIFGIAIVVIGILAIARYLDQQRTEALKQAAEELGLQFLPGGDSRLQEHLAAFHLFNQGHGRKLRNLVLGDAGEITISIFDYQFTTGGGQHQNTRHQTVASLQSTQLQIPSFTMRPEGLFDRIGSVFGSQDIDFESHPDFSNMFLLKSPNESKLREFFDPSILDYFQNKNGVCVESTPEQMIMYYAGKRMKPPELKSFLQEAYTVYGMFVDRCQEIGDKHSS